MKILIFDNYDSFTYNLVHLVEKITHEKVDVYRNDKLPLEEVKKYDKIILSPGPGIPSEAGLLLPLIKEYAATKSILGVCLGHQAIGEAFGGKLINLSSVFHGVATPVRVVKRETSNVNKEAVNRQTSNVNEEAVNRQTSNVNKEAVKRETSNVNEEAVKRETANVNEETANSDSRFTIHGSRKDLFNGLPETFLAGRYHSWIVSKENFPGELEITAEDENGFIMALQHKTYDVQGVQFHPESVLTPDGEKIMRNWLNPHPLKGSRS